MSVKQAQAQIDSAEYTEWMAYHNINPFTYKSTDNILANIAAMLANTLKKPNVQPFTKADFLPALKPEHKIETAKDMEMKLKAVYPA